jgi:hypothetical protein
MDGPLIAIVGSYDPKREKELGLRNLDQTSKASEELGRELAKQGYRIVIYTGNPFSMELDLVRGYLSQKDLPPGSIQVLYSQQHGQPTFAEEAGNEDKFYFRPDYNPDWEFSFYQSLSKVDGMLILGGGPSALIAGLVIIGHRKPIVACASFGGSGDKIWNALRARAEDYAVTEADLGLMASRWSPMLSSRLVDLFRKEREEFERQARVKLENEEKRIQEIRNQQLQENARINWHAIVSALLFCAAASAWPFGAWLVSRVDTNWEQALWIVLLTPMFAGASGASIRVVVDWAIGVNRTFELSTYNQHILLRYLALGIVAGGLAGVSFVLAQLFASQVTEDAAMARQLGKLVPFLVIIGFAAGLAAEVVLSNLRKSPPTIALPGIKAKSAEE